jgi:hypothetical protein
MAGGHVLDSSQADMAIFAKAKEKERERYYLLAGMGGKRALRQKRVVMLWWSIGVGVCVSAFVAGILYFMHNHW